MELYECVNFLLTKAQLTVFKYFKSQLAEFDVTPVQYGILKCLWREDGQMPGQIAVCLGLDGSTITGILDRMESKGLLKRTPDPNDRRALRVIITDQGSKLQEPVEKVIISANLKVLQALTPEDKEKLFGFLRGIIEEN